MTEPTLQKLEQAFAIGASDLEACLFADISPATLYSYQERNPQFLERKTALKQNPILRARQMVVKSIEEDVKNAQWYLERKAKDFKPKSDVNLEVVQPILGGVAKNVSVHPSNPKAIETPQED